MKARDFRLFTATIVAGAMLIQALPAQSVSDDEVSQRGSSRVAGSQQQPMAPVQTPPPAGPPAKEKSFEEWVKDYSKMTGVFTLYRNKKGVNDSVLMEVPESALNKYFILQATASTGIASGPAQIFHGAPMGDTAFTIQKVDDSRLVFTWPDRAVRSPRDAEGARALDRAVMHRVAGTFEIKAKNKENGNYLIDVTDFLKSDIPDIGVGMAPYQVDRANTYIDSLKDLPENFVVRTTYRLVARTPQTGTLNVPFSVVYIISSLPTSGYKPRLADTRIGYFTTNFQDWSNPQAQDKVVNYIARWNLEKADPTAAVSEPKKPIVFWIDNAVPLKYRNAVKEGLEFWNPVFEKEVGIRNAIVVKQMPDDADWDIADVRYNVVRWTTGLPFAISLFRTNPFTGEILNSGINMDAVFAQSEHWIDYIFGPGSQPKAMSPYLKQYKDQLCFDADEVAMQLNAAADSIEAVYGVDAAQEKERLIQQYIAEVVAHELGHSLGLRHNFAASTARTTAQLADPAFSKNHALTASIMDYMPYNIFALKHPGVDYFSRMPGEYDSWAIHYGYMSVPGNTPQDELPTLKAWASRDGEPGLRFETDQLANDAEPTVYTFDMADNPLDWLAKRQTTMKYLIDTLPQRKPKHGESYYEFTKTFTYLLANYATASSDALRFVGGVELRKNFKGDTGEKPVIRPVSAEQQRRALSMAVNGLLSERSLSFPKSYYYMLTANPNVPGTQAFSILRETPIFNLISNYQVTALGEIFDPSKLNRMVNNEFRSQKTSETLTMATMFNTVGGAVWSELSTGHEISQLRRQLQRAHLKELIDMVVDRPAGVPEDAITLAYDQLKWLQEATAKAAKTAPGEYGKAYLNETHQRITQALTASLQKHSG
ncbi:MAG: zinc-dependent metalloprotease [Armatimonadetes bacterium]|nr:zinc-dependent metalloprotease [Armatimonadota bacterium]